MKKFLAFIILCVSVSGYSQSQSDLVIKLKPLNFLMGNPGFEFEKRITNRFSLSFDATMINFWFSDRNLDLGLDDSWDFKINLLDPIRTNNGYKFGVVGKVYLGREPDLAGLYLGVLLRNKFVDASKSRIIEGKGANFTSQTMKANEAGLMMGYQFKAQRFRFDLASGIFVKDSKRKATFTEQYGAFSSVKAKELKLTELQPYFNFTIGYCLVILNSPGPTAVH